MRTAVALLTFALLLSGCSSGGGGGGGNDGDGTDFDDVDVKATETTGILRGVTVDEAIRPLPGVKVDAVGPDGQPRNATTDDTGRFVFGDLAPGTYLLNAKLLNFQDAQTVAEVVAGDNDPRTVRVQLARLFSQEPFSNQVNYDGFLACAYRVGPSSTCVNDYTRITGEQCVPVVNQCYCAGGCLRDFELAKAAGNIREYVTSIEPGWTTIVEEMTWEPTSEAGKELGVTVSYYSRPNANHWFASEVSAAPLRLEIKVGEEHSSAEFNAANGEPGVIPPEGMDELFPFFGAGDGVVINQKFTSIQSNFYHGYPPDGWSFMRGDKLPF